jgi:hypothetical protein
MSLVYEVLNVLSESSLVLYMMSFLLASLRMFIRIRVGAYIAGYQYYIDVVANMSHQS